MSPGTTSAASPVGARRRAAAVALLAALLSHAGWSATGEQGSALGSGGFYEDALRYERAGDLAAAVIQLRNALQENPGHLPSRILLGRLHLQTGDPKSAERELRIARDRGADENLVLVPLAAAYLSMSRHEELLSQISAQGHAARVDGQLLLMRAQAYLAIRRLHDAESAYVNAARKLQDSVAPLVGRARVERARGRLEEAEALIDRALDRNPAHADSWFEKGLFRRQAREFDIAIAYLDQALELDPLHLRARNARASILIETGRLDEASGDVQFVREHNPVDGEAIYLETLLHMRRGDMKQARHALDSALEIVSTLSTEGVESFPSLLLLSGMVRYSLGDIEATVSALESYLTKVPGHPGASKVLAAVLLEKGQYVEAVRYLEPLAFGIGNDPVAYTLLGDAYMGAGRFADAADMFERAAGLATEPADALTKLAASRLRAGEQQLAVQDLESVLELHPGSLPAGIMLARLHLRMRRYEAALEVTQHLQREHPNSVQVFNLMGAAYAGQDDLVGARRSYSKALVVDPDDLAAQINIAKIDTAEGQFDMASARLELILEKHPEEVTTKAAMARLAERQGRIDEAVGWLEKARAINPRAIDEQVTLIRLYLRLAAVDEARDIATGLEERFPEDLRVLLALGQTMQATGMVPRAQLAFRRLAKFAGFDTAWLYRVSKEQVGIGDLEGAQWSLQKALQGAPTTCRRAPPASRCCRAWGG